MTMTNQCFNCIWFYPDEPVLTCAAFAPAPIPEEIITGEVSHNKVRADQVWDKPVYVSYIPLIGAK